MSAVAPADDSKNQWLNTIQINIIFALSDQHSIIFFVKFVKSVVISVQ